MLLSGCCKQIIETDTAFLGRYYHTLPDGTRKQKPVTLAMKSEAYRSKKDVQPLLDRLIASLNSEVAQLSGRVTLTDFGERKLAN